jgi:hypothetical protein
VVNRSTAIRNDKSKSSFSVLNKDSLLSTAAQLDIDEHGRM